MHTVGWWNKQLQKQHEDKWPAQLFSMPLWLHRIRTHYFACGNPVEARLCAFTITQVYTPLLCHITFTSHWMEAQILSVPLASQWWKMLFQNGLRLCLCAAFCCSVHSCIIKSQRQPLSWHIFCYLRQIQFILPFLEQRECCWKVEVVCKPECRAF